MDYIREARATIKVTVRNRRSRSGNRHWDHKNRHCSTIHRRIVRVSEGPHNSPRSLDSVKVVSNVPSKPSGLVLDKRRSQWSPNTSEYSGNIEKAPIADSYDVFGSRSPTKGCFRTVGLANPPATSLTLSSHFETRNDLELDKETARDSSRVKLAHGHLLRRWPRALDPSRFKSKPVGHALHGVQRHKPSIMGSNAFMHIERTQPECGMGSSLELPLHSE
ncbi:hypothetical protein CRG98_041815 [Punica granatum]|uniref:Uncharacterized protein n=1 Tax=Punica granatum TaxID=22663 RepID=A0A2I0I1E9_PUNGR|nr:hypothetical protein CRG98_041815 [Punica granatum]